MKKLLFIAVVALATTACTKDRTCTCTDTYGSTSETNTYTIKDATKGQAKANCVSTSQTSGTVTITSDCKLS